MCVYHQLSVIWFLTLSCGHKEPLSEIGSSNEIRMADAHNLTVVTYNLHGFNQGISLLTSSCSKGGDFCSGTLVGAVRLASVVQLV